MHQQLFRGARIWVVMVLVAMSLTPTLMWAQRSVGNVNVTVFDPQGAVVTGAQLTLVDLATNDTRRATTQDAGTYTFVGLSFGEYKLTVAKAGFGTQSYSVLVQSARDTDVKAMLQIGSTAQEVTVEGGVAPVIETTTNATNITIDTKQIEDLPLGGRNIAGFATLSAGYNGTWNGLPTHAQGNTVDGILGNTGRWKYSSSATNVGVTPRLENIGEMTVSTDQLDMNQGWGTSNMQITFVTRRGSNNWHGRVFEDFRSSVFDANNWGSATKAKYHLNEFGGSIGGPIIKDKAFFFASLSSYKRPGGALVRRNYLADPAKTGVFTYGNGVTVNLFNVASAYNTANGTTFPTSVFGLVNNRLQEVDQYRQNKGYAYSILPSDPNLRTWEWMNTQPVTNWYPTLRLDYNVSQSKRLNVALNQTKTFNPNTNAEHWPGDGRGADNRGRALNASLGFDWTVTPTIINQFKFGYLYTANWFGINGPQDFFTKPTIQYRYGDYNDYYEMPNSRMQPVFSISDSVSWAKGAHMLAFGFTAYRDQNKYWDPPEGYMLMGLGMVETDPVSSAFSKTALQARSSNPAAAMTDAEWSSARQLYATLTGRISGYWGRHAYDPKTGDYLTGVGSSTLNELMKSWGLFFQDSYKLRPNFTLNYGLRWDFVSPDKDLTNKYHSLTVQDLFGPTEAGKLFQPGAATLTGTMNPSYVSTATPYDSWKVTPQPAIGFAWSPRSDGTFIEKLMGGQKTVVRAAYALRRFTESQQFVWDTGSSYAIGFYQSFWSNPDNSGLLGSYTPGSKRLGDPYPAVALSPATFMKSIPMKDSTFGNFAAAGIKDGIRQPYTQSWNLGFQRELGPSRAIEVRYNGNRTIRQWIAMNINEVNIFENGFLDEFKSAVNNYNLNHAAGVESFANRGLAGQVNLPILTAAGVSFTSSTFLNQIKNGQVGSMAGTLATNRDYYCRLVGTQFSPCGTAYGAGKGYPLNFWLVNPFAIGAWTGNALMGDAGFSNYNGLQVEYRQRNWHGVNGTVNYTWSRTLGVATAGDWTGAFTQFTLRDLRSSYGPAGTDRNHVIHASATYDLPFGKGKQFLSRGGVVDKVLGGWTVSTIVTFQSGSPFRISGNNNTFNNLRDGGVVLNGITKDDFVEHMGRYTDSTGRPYFLDPTWVSSIKSSGQVSAFNTPGQWGTILYLHGPHQTYTDIGISKAVAFTERIRFKFQSEMLNAFNHPTFGQNSTGIASTTFGSASQNATSRRIEFRANLEF